MGGSDTLSLVVITFLHNQGIFVIKDITIASLSSTFSTHWKYANELEMPEHMVSEWKAYILKLKLYQIFLSPKKNWLI